MGPREPRLIRHIMLRVKDVMSSDVAVANKNDPLRNVGPDDGQAEHKPAPDSRRRRLAYRDHHGAEPGAHVRARVARGLHLRRQPGLCRGDGRGAGGRASGRGERQRVLGPAVGHLDERGLDGQIHEARRRRGDRGPPEGPEAGHRAWSRGARRLQRGTSRRRGPGDGQGAGEPPSWSPPSTPT